tara:strand:- start:1339 stop:1908 length:570 start_codon:yes stop_codon:yes gene_type:complete
MVTFPQAVALGFRRYFDFRGRSTRAEFWWWQLFGILVSIFLAIVDAISFGAESSGPLQSLFGLATLIPGLALYVRRLHDIGKTGWWALWFFLIYIFAVVLITVGIVFLFTEFNLHVLIGTLILVSGMIVFLSALVVGIIWAVRKGDEGENRFGPPSPHADATSYANDRQDTKRDDGRERRTGYSRRRQE